MVTRLPNIRALVDPLLGAPYTAYDCWALARYLLKAGLDLDVATQPYEAAAQLMELWYRGDPRDPLTLVQPWDIYLMAIDGPISDHLGLVVDTQVFVHTRRRTGVCLERLTRWRPKLLQLARLRMLA